MDKVFKYYAFISYKHEDEKWAKWLQKRLETYRLPVALQKQQHCPKKLKPVFRDNTDMTPGNLAEKLHENLELSNYLIVICSKNLAKESRYVDYEMQTFINMGRGDKIIPFIVDGEPYAADPRNECFNAMMKNFPGELLAANAKKDGKRTAALKVIASILRLNADDLIKRDKKRKSLRNALISVASVVSAMFLCITLGITFNLTAQNYEKEAINSNNYSDYSSAIKYAVKSLKVPFNKDKTGEAAQILRSRVIADELNKSNNQFHKNYEININSPSFYIYGESPDGSMVAVCDYSIIRIYDSENGKYLTEYEYSDREKAESYLELEEKEITEDTVTSKYTITESIDYSFLGTRCFYVYDDNNKEVFKYYEMDKNIEVKYLFTDNEEDILFFGSTVSMYSFSEDKAIAFSVAQLDEKSKISSVKISPKGKYAFVEVWQDCLGEYSKTKSTMYVYNLSDGKLISMICDENDSAYESANHNFYFSQDMQSLYVNKPNKIEKYSFTDEKSHLLEMETEDGYYIHDYTSMSVFVSDDFSKSCILKIFEYDNGAVFTVFNTYTGEEISSMKFKKSPSFAVTPNIETLIYSDGETIGVVDIDTGKPLFKKDTGLFYTTDSVMINEDGSYAAYRTSNNEVVLLKKGEEYYEKKETYYSSSTSAIHSLHGNKLVVTLDFAVYEINTETKEKILLAESEFEYFGNNFFDILTLDQITNYTASENHKTLLYDKLVTVRTGSDENISDSYLFECDYSPKHNLLVGSPYVRFVETSEIVVEV